MKYISDRDACVKLNKRPLDGTTVSPLSSEKASAMAAAEYGVRRLCAAAAPAVAAAGSSRVRQRQWWRQRAKGTCGDGVPLVSRRDGK